MRASANPPMPSSHSGRSVATTRRSVRADLADALGMGSAFAVEFVELGLGDRQEQSWHAGQTNAAGLHGNACLSRFPIDRAAMIPLDPGGFWFRDDAPKGEQRVGSRQATGIRTRLADGRGLWTFAVHFESELDPADRAREMAALLEGIAAVAADDPVVIGGDLNTGAFPHGTGASTLATPQALEPLFGLAAAAGYTWSAANTAEPTKRQLPDRKPITVFNKIDWFLVRNIDAFDPKVIAAVDADGTGISDHELLTIRARP